MPSVLESLEKNLAAAGFELPLKPRIGTENCAGIEGLVPQWHREYPNKAFFSPEDATALCAAVNLAPALIAAARAADDYESGHHMTCAANDPDHKRKCTCGYEALREALAPLLKENPDGR